MQFSDSCTAFDISRSVDSVLFEKFKLASGNFWTRSNLLIFFANATTFRRQIMMLTSIRRMVSDVVLLSKRPFSQATGGIKFKPMFDRILVEKFAPEVKSKGGIMIPEKAQGKVLEGTIVAVGPGARNEVRTRVHAPPATRVCAERRPSSNVRVGGRSSAVATMGREQSDHRRKGILFVP